MLADQLVLLAPTTDACLFRKHRDTPSRQMP
jgi:hypothetical protein